MRRSCPVLVGRDEDLRALEAAVADRGARPVVLIGGEAGVGKSRLVAELAVRVADGAATAIGSCIHLGADALPYAPFIDGLARYVALLGERAEAVLGPGRHDLATLLPELATDHEPAVPGDAGLSRGRLYEAVRSALDRAPDPLVFVIEDVHWADQSSLELLSYLASRLREGRTAIVATFRTDELHRRHPLVPVLAELARGGRATRLDLERLDPDGVATMVRAMLGPSPGLPLAAVAARSDGNPFLVEELLSVDVGGSRLPETLRDLLLARIGSMSEPARRLLGLLAILGRPAEMGLVEAALGDAPELDAALREAVDRGVLVVEPARGHLAFRHALIAEAVADDVLPGERTRLHATVARVLGERPGLASPTRAGAAAEIAHHLVAAGDLPAAFLASVRAGDAAAAARAYPEARVHLERALDLLEQLPDGGEAQGPGRIRLLDAAAEACFHSGDAGRAVALGRLALDAGGPGLPPADESYLICRLLEWLELSGGPDDMEHLARRAVALVPADPPSPGRAFAMLSLAAVRMHAGRDRAALELAREAVAAAAACGDTAREACARSMVAVGLAELGRDQEAVDEVERAVALADRTRGPVETGVTHLDRLAILSLVGRFEELDRALEPSRAALDREGLHELCEPFLVTDQVDLLAWQGRWDDAEQLVARTLDGQPSRLPLANLLAVRGQLHARRGRLAAAREDLRAVLEIRPPVEPETRAAALGSLAEAALADADPRAAIGLAEDGLATLEPTAEVPGRAHLFALGLWAAADLAERARARRDRGAEADAVARAKRHVEGLLAAQAGALVEGGASDGRVAARVAWGLAEDARRTGSTDPEPWAEAAQALARTGEPHLAAWCRYREAEACLGRGDRVRAQAGLRLAHAWAAAACAEPLRGAVEGLARRARIDLGGIVAPEVAPAGTVPVVGADDPYGLSAREREVLALLLDGRTNREIGAALFITDKTASSHVTHILDKLGVTSRGAAAALAARGGLVGDRGARSEAATS